MERLDEWELSWSYLQNQAIQSYLFKSTWYEISYYCHGPFTISDITLQIHNYTVWLNKAIEWFYIDQCSAWIEWNYSFFATAVHSDSVLLNGKGLLHLLKNILLSNHFTIGHHTKLSVLLSGSFILDTNVFIQFKDLKINCIHARIQFPSGSCQEIFIKVVFSTTSAEDHCVSKQTAYSGNFRIAIKQKHL